MSNFNTNNVSNMDNMFRGCSKLSYLDLSMFNTSNIKCLNSMFYGCSNLVTLNLANFDTSECIFRFITFYYIKNSRNYIYVC